MYEDRFVVNPLCDECDKPFKAGETILLFYNSYEVKARGANKKKDCDIVVEYTVSQPDFYHPECFAKEVLKEAAASSNPLITRAACNKPVTQLIKKSVKCPVCNTYIEIKKKG